MYGHHIVDDFNNLIKKPIKDKVYIDAVKSVVDSIKHAQHFFLGPYKELIHQLSSFAEEQEKTQIFLGSSSRYIRLPYKSCWFEFEDKSFTVDETVPVPKRGLLVNELDVDLFKVLIVNWVEEWRRWVLSPQIYMVLVGRTFGDDLERSGKYVANVALRRGAPPIFLDWLMKSNTYPMSATDKQLSWDTVMGCRADDQRDLYVLNAALLLLNCKNIETEDNQPPSKLNRKRSKKGKQELFTYKTLALKLPLTRQDPHGNAVSNNNRVRIHLCRGHFKIFTEDAPLFGKHTGLYWWDPHLRGDKAKGLVVKDYIVKTRQ